MLYQKEVYEAPSESRANYAHCTPTKIILTTLFFDAIVRREESTYTLILDEDVVASDNENVVENLKEVTVNEEAEVRDHASNQEAPNEELSQNSLQEPNRVNYVLCAARVGRPPQERNLQYVSVAERKLLHRNRVARRSRLGISILESLKKKTCIEDID